MDSLIELFCDVDDFCQPFGPAWRRQLRSAGEIQRQRERRLRVSEIITILIHVHQSHDRNCKAHATEYVLARLRGEFPGLVSANRLVAFIPSVVVVRCACLRTCRLGTWTGISFIDSTALAVCNNPSIHAHKACAGLAQRGKMSTGWLFGFTLQLIVNDRDELLNVMLTPGNVDDRKPVPKMVRRIFGSLFGDKGYRSKTLRDELLRAFNVELVTGVRATMKNALMPWMDKLLLRKRAIVETITDQRKNVSHIEHSRHRSPINFLVNLLCGLIAYCR